MSTSVVSLVRSGMWFYVEVGNYKLKPRIPGNNLLRKKCKNMQQKTKQKWEKKQNKRTKRRKKGTEKR